MKKYDATLKTISAKVDDSEKRGNGASSSMVLESYDDAMELTGNGSYNYLLLVTCSVISIAVALDLFGFGLVVAASACDLSLSMEQKGVLSSIPFAGILFAFPWGFFADTAGRRRALVWSTSVGFLFAALSSLATHWYYMLALKFIGCSFSTAAFSITMTLLGECTGDKHRSQYLQIMNSINLASEAVSFLLALFVLPLHFSPLVPWLGITYRPWRLLTFLMSVPLGLGALMMLLLHESPKFLANRGQEAKALEVLENIFVKNGGVRGEFPVKSLIISNNNNKEESKKSFWGSIAEQTLPIFKPPLLLGTIQLFYLLLIICSTNNVFAMWFPTMVNSFFKSLASEGPGGEKTFCNRLNENATFVPHADISTCNDVISNDTIYSGIGYGLFFMVVNLVVSQLSQFRRLVLLTTLVVSAVSSLLVDLIRQPVANLIFFVLLQSTSICIGIAASYFIDFFPTSYRALATSLGMMIGRIGSFIGVNLVGVAITNYCSTTFYSWTIFVLSGVIVALFLPSDGKVKSISKPPTWTGPSRPPTRAGPSRPPTRAGPSKQLPWAGPSKPSTRAGLSSETSVTFL